MVSDNAHDNDNAFFPVMVFKFKKLLLVLLKDLTSFLHLTKGVSKVGKVPQKIWTCEKLNFDVGVKIYHTSKGSR